MGNEVKYQALVGDVLRLLVERAAQAGGPPGSFDQGVKMGYFEAVASNVSTSTPLPQSV